MSVLDRSTCSPRWLATASSFALMVVALLSPPVARALTPPSSYGAYTILAKRSLIVGTNVTIRGPIGVLEKGGMLSMGPESIHTAVRRDQALACSDIFQLKPESSVVDVITNDLRAEASAQVTGVVQKPLATPFLDLPPLPKEVSDRCVDSAPKVEVKKNTARTLTPGCYGDVTLEKNGRLFLQPGVYNFRSWKLSVSAAIVGNPGKVTIYLRDAWASAPGVLVGPNSSISTQFLIFTGAQSIDVREEGGLIAELFAPNADLLTLWPRSVFEGHAVADRVLIEDESLCGNALNGPPPPPLNSLPKPKS